MSEKRQPKIQYEIVDPDALALRFPELVVRDFDKEALYKKVRAANELGTEIPGVRIGPKPAAPPAPLPLGVTVVDDPGAPLSTAGMRALVDQIQTAPPKPPVTVGTPAAKAPAAAVVCEPIPDPAAKPALTLKPTAQELEHVPDFLKKQAEQQQAEDDGLPF